MRIGERQIVGIARHDGTHMGFFVEHHEPPCEIEVVHVVAKDDEEVVAREEGHHVGFRELQLVVDIGYQGVARKGVVVKAVGLKTRGILYALDFGRLPVVAAMDEGVVEYLALAVDDVERQGKAFHHVVDRDDRVAQLVAIGKKLHGLHFRLVVEVAAGQAKVLGK